MIVAVALGVAAGVAVAFVLSQTLLRDEVGTVRDLLATLGRLGGVAGGTRDQTTGLRLAGVGLASLGAAALVAGVVA